MGYTESIKGAVKSLVIDEVSFINNHYCFAQSRSRNARINCTCELVKKDFFSCSANYTKLIFVKESLGKTLRKECKQMPIESRLF